MFIVVTINGEWVTRIAAFSTSDGAVEFLDDHPDIMAQNHLIEWIDEDEDMYYSINR